MSQPQRYFSLESIALSSDRAVADFLEGELRDGENKYQMLDQLRPGEHVMVVHIRESAGTAVSVYPEGAEKKVTIQGNSERDLIFPPFTKLYIEGSGSTIDIQASTDIAAFFFSNNVKAQITGTISGVTTVDEITTSNIVRKGSIITVSGTFTKSGAGSGSVRFSVGAGNICWLMFGNALAGSIRGTTTGALQIDITQSGNAVIVRIGDLDPAGISEALRLPSPGGNANAANNVAASDDMDQMAIDAGEKLAITLGTMADAETFTVNFRLWSLTGTTPTATASGGTFA